MMLYVCFLEV